MKLLQYTAKPADWNNLGHGEKLVERLPVEVAAPFGYPDDREMAEG